MLRKIAWLILCIFGIHGAAWAQQRIGAWQSYLPYNIPTSVAQSSEQIFVGTETGIYTYDKADGVVQTYSRTNSLNDQNVSRIAYSPKNDLLVVAYNNGVIDLLGKSGRATPIYDLKNANVLGSKKINNIIVKGDTAYLSCDFGIVLLDIVRREVRDTYIVGSNGNNVAVYDLAISQQQIAVATEEGLKVADLNNSVLANYVNWQAVSGLPIGIVRRVVAWNNDFYALVGTQIWQYGSNGMQLRRTTQAGWRVQDMELYNNRLLLCEWVDATAQSRIVCLDDNFETIQTYAIWNLNRPTQALLDESNNTWAADVYQGLHRILSPDYSEIIQPNGPYSNKIADMAFNPRNNELWVAAGGVDGSYNAMARRDGIFRYADQQWTTYRSSNVQLMSNVIDFIFAKPNPYQNEVYFASYGGGLVHYDYTDFTVFDKTNSPLNNPADNPTQCLVAGLDFDTQGNLWVINSRIDRPVVVRQADGEWLSFKPTNVGSVGRLNTMLVDDYNQKWMIHYRAGIIVMNTGNDLQTTTDDQYKNLSAAAGNGALPSDNVLCMVKDQEGTIWVGTDNGIGIFYCPFAVFTTGCDAEKPYVETDGFGAYLLENETVRAIAVDGANRKWVGTDNGIFLLSPDGTETIHYFTTANSPLLSNVIMSIAIDSPKGVVYIGTDQGLMSYQSDALEATNTATEVLVYPNPVRPDYVGDIMVKGLAYNSSVKITDINGHLVHEGTALGSQLVWDGNDHTGKRVRSGVYLVFATNADHSQQVVSKFVVVN